MRRPSARCTPVSVTIQHVTSWTSDSAGARQPVYGTPAGPYHCALDPDSAEETADHARDSEVIQVVLVFHDDWSIRIRDLITWGTRVLNVVGVSGPRSGKNRSWVVTCEERK